MGSVLTVEPGGYSLLASLSSIPEIFVMHIRLNRKQLFVYCKDCILLQTELAD